MNWSPLCNSKPWSGSAFTVIDGSGRRVELEEVPAADLISPTLFEFSQNTILADRSVSISLHVTGGPREIGGGPYGSQTINSLSIPESFQDFLKTSIQRLDSIVDVDFSVSTDQSKGDIDFYFDQEINVKSAGGTILGLALSNSSASRGGWWETILNAPAFGNNLDYLKYAGLHELGHCLGLEHPFESSDGDFYGSTNPYSSAYPEQTVMAYRFPASGSWPTFYSDSDLEALVTLLGKELQLYNQENNIIYGKGYSEKINGAQGNDWISGGGGSDELYGGKDNDWINGNQGDDGINGNMGSDILRGGQGNDTIFGGKDDDQLFGDLGNDRLRGDLGDDALTGGTGADLFILSPGFDTALDFNPNEGDRLGISPGSSYSVDVISDGTLISQDNQSMLLKSVFIDASLISRSIQFI